MKRLENLQALGGLALVFFLLYFWFAQAPLFLTGLVILGLGLLEIPPSAALARGWLGLLRGIGQIVSPLVLGLVYYLAITPLALGYRLLARERFRRFHGRDEESLFVVDEREFGPESFDNPW